MHRHISNCIHNNLHFQTVQLNMNKKLACKQGGRCDVAAILKSKLELEGSRVLDEIFKSTNYNNNKPRI